MVRKKQTILLKPICKDQAQPIREKLVFTCLPYLCLIFSMLITELDVIKL